MPNWITRRRWELGLTQARLAEMTGSHVRSVKAWEAGTAVISARKLPKVAKALRVTTLRIVRELG